MRGFVLGLLVAATAFAGFVYYERDKSPPAPTPTLRPDAGPAAKKVRRRRARGATRVARGTPEGQVVPAAPAEAPQTPSDRAAQARLPRGLTAPEPEPEPEPIKLTAADLKTVGQGDDLSKPDVLRLDMGNDSEAKELTQDQIDERFRAEEGAILDCISKARPDEETYVPGRVTIKFRIQRAGTVRGVRVEGPSILMKGGLYNCAKGVVMRLRFPAAGSSQIVAYPFSLS
jgi:hypothetical protein